MSFEMGLNIPDQLIQMIFKENDLNLMRTPRNEVKIKRKEFQVQNSEMLQCWEDKNVKIN